MDGECVQLTMLLLAIYTIIAAAVVSLLWRAMGPFQLVSETKRPQLTPLDRAINSLLTNHMVYSLPFFSQWNEQESIYQSIGGRLNEKFETNILSGELVAFDEISIKERFVDILERIIRDDESDIIKNEANPNHSSHSDKQILVRSLNNSIDSFYLRKYGDIHRPNYKRFNSGGLRYISNANSYSNRIFMTSHQAKKYNSKDEIKRDIHRLGLNRTILKYLAMLELNGDRLVIDSHYALKVDISKLARRLEMLDESDHFGEKDCSEDFDG